jgi:hypothetical protein
MQNNIKLAQEDSYENSLHYGIQCLKKKDKMDLKTYQEIVDEYKKISVVDLIDTANEIFNWNKCLITTLSPVKIFNEHYKKIIFDIDESKSKTKTKTKTKTIKNVSRTHESKTKKTKKTKK